MHAAPPSDTQVTENLFQDRVAPRLLRAYWNNFYSRGLLTTLEQLCGGGFLFKKISGEDKHQIRKKIPFTFPINNKNQFSISPVFVPRSKAMRCNISKLKISTMPTQEFFFCPFLTPTILVKHASYRVHQRND